MKTTFIFLAGMVLSSSISLAQEQEKPKELDEVVVEKETSTYTTKNGNIKVDVANSIYNAVPNTIDLIAKLPKIQISPDKQSISIIGKGNPLVYIDNQKVDCIELNSLAVDDIKTIEIINNPSSKYEAEGRAVILITRKFSKKEGYKVILSETTQFKKYINNYSGINTNFKTGKLEFKANFNYNQLKVWESNGNDFTIPDYSIQSNYLVTAVTQRPQFLFGGGVFYKINNDDYVSLNSNRRQQKDIFDIDTYTVNQDLNGTNNINTMNLNNEHREFTNTYLNYNHKIKSREVNLFTGLQYSSFNQQIASVISNNYNDTGFVLAQDRNQKFATNVASGRIDLEKKFKNETRVEFGGLYLQANAVTDFEVATINPVTSTQSNYRYKEENIATYTQVSGNYKKLSYSTGLRAENTIVKGTYDTSNDVSIRKNYINLFPKAEMEVAIDSSNTVSLNYAKSITRPDYSSTSQVSTYINPYFIWSNNINLNPSISDEITFNYQYKDKSLRVAYYRTTNPTFYGASYDDSQNILTFTTTNFEKETDFALELTLPFKYKIWKTTNVINLGQSKIEDNSAVVNSSKPSLYAYTNHIFSFHNTVELSFTAWGYTPQQLGVFDRSGLITMDAAISKTFFKQWDCTLSFDDIFRKMNFKDNFTINKVSTKGIYYTDSHLISVSIKYSFGKIKNSEFKEKSVDENSGRIK